MDQKLGPFSFAPIINERNVFEIKDFAKWTNRLLVDKGPGQRKTIKTQIETSTTSLFKSLH